MIDELSLNVNSALTDMKELSDSSNQYNKSNTGSSVDLKIDGLFSVQSLNFLFSPSVDKMIDVLLDVCINGEFSEALSKLDQFVKMFDSMGVGSGFFNGRVGSHIINIIRSSVNSIKFQKTSSKIKKVLLVLKNLKKQLNKVKDPVVKQQYEDAVYAIKSIIKVIALLYKQRKTVNSRVIRGLNNLVFESENDDIITISKIAY